MKKEHVVIIILVILLAVVAGAWIFTSQFQLKGKDWVSTLTWTGSQAYYTKTTEDFVIAGDEWRIMWSCSQIVGSSHFDIAVYDSYTDGIVKWILPPDDPALSGEHYMNQTGRFYLNIYINGNLGNWSVHVEEYR